MSGKYLVAIGSICIDDYYELDDLPRMGDKIICRYLGSKPGGMIGNAVSVYASYGISTYLIAFLNTGAQAEMLLDDIKQYHVNTDYISRDEKLPDTKCIIMLKNGERLIFAVNNGKSDLELSKAQINLLKNAEFVYTTITELLSLRNYSAIIENFRKVGSRLVLDVEGNTITKEKEVEDIIRQGDILFINESGVEQLSALWGNGFIEELTENGALAVLTLGAHGCKVVRKGCSHISFSAFDVELTDTTGAGDTFNSSFLFGLSQGWDINDTACFSNAAAARSIGILGPRSGAVGEKAVREFMDRYVTKY